MRPNSTYLDAIKTERESVRWNLAGTTPAEPDLVFGDIEVAENLRAGRLRDLTEKLARLSNRDPDQINIAPGASQAFMQTLAAVTTPGDVVVVESPTYEPIVAAARFLGLTILSFERTLDFQRDLDQLAALAPRASTLVITNPNCPTGMLYSTAEFRALARLFPNFIVDESYLPIFTAGRVTMLDEDEGISIGSLSKSMGLSGLRVGWTLATRSAIAKVTSLSRLFQVDMPTPSLACATRALRNWDEVTQGWARIAQINRSELRSRSELNAFLSAYPVDRGHFFCLAIPRAQESAATFVEHLKRQHSILVRSGHFFGLARHVRISALLEPSDFSEAIARIAKEYGE